MNSSRLAAKLHEAQDVLRRDTYNRDPPTRKERAWAKRSPEYKLGDRVLAYRDDEPGSILCADTRYPGYWFVLMDEPEPDNRRGWLSVGWDNLVRAT